MHQISCQILFHEIGLQNRILGNKLITRHSVSEKQEFGANTKAMLTRIFRVEKAQSLPPWDACPASQADIISTQDPIQTQRLPGDLFLC